MDAALGFFLGLPTPVLYAVLALGSATENLLPPVPADTFILLGGFLAGRGRLDAWTVFGVTWAANVTSALAVYGIGHRYGRSFFEIGMGRRILHQGQLARMEGFYRRWGTYAIFLTRFLPGFRAVVPVFAGVSHQPARAVAIPLAAASAIWYGILVWLGATMARNLETLFAWLGGANRVFLVVAVVLGGMVAGWWWKTRHRGGAKEPGEENDRRDSGG